MARKADLPVDSERHRLRPDQLRWRCDPKRFSFKTTDEIEESPIQIIGQPRALAALRLGLSVHSEGYNIFVSGAVGSGRSTVVRRMLSELDRGEEPPQDLVYAHNFRDSDQPRLLQLPAGKGTALKEAITELINSLVTDLPKLYESEVYSRSRAGMIEEAASQQKARFKEYEQAVQDRGLTLVQVQHDGMTLPHLVPMVAGNPVEMDELEELVDKGGFKRDDYESLQEAASELRSGLESMGKDARNLERELHRRLATLDREVAEPMVKEAFDEVRAAFKAEGLADFWQEFAADVLDHLAEFREARESDEGADEKTQQSIVSSPRYQINVVVDNSRTTGMPIIWETAPSYRNLFGTIEKTRVGDGDWVTDHTRIKAGSLLAASGGIIVLDAMDVLVEPGVWAALKRTLRTSQVEMRAFDPFQFLSGISLKPAPAPIDVKVVMIGTSFIHRLLHAVDEDFKKIFKVKAQFAVHTRLEEEELQNYARFVCKKVQDDKLQPFCREAVAAVVEHGVRLSGNHDKLTTRFAEIADVIRESGYWAAEDNADCVQVEHVDRALEARAHRVNLIEEMMRERIAEGTVLLDMKGQKIGQVNGLAVLDLGDHVFAQPVRITASTAMGRNGIINIDREAEMSGAIHTKGVFILAGFLRSRFAQDKPLTLTASLCFEQSYGSIDGDSASSTELYALLSSLAEAPIRQGVAVTGSVNQRGEIQPIGGVNEKIEGYFDLCRLMRLGGAQGVMIPARNLPQLMLRKDLIAAIEKGRFHVWAVNTIEEGLGVLTGLSAGRRSAGGAYPPESLFGRADAKLVRLAEQVSRFGPADLAPTV